ncbi:hypothetical protein [Trinickia sp.]|uniref:hypothetical protein n=1 Tax=Trinickia sp. TaxID=2571163 RepID=UPI003F7E8345
MAFSKSVADELWRYAGHRCSSPHCGAALTGPGVPGNYGEAAHIKGEKPGAARYDVRQSDGDRVAASNGIYLCVACHRFVDRCEAAYPVDLLHRWKDEAHQRFLEEVKPGRARGFQGTVDLADNSKRARAFLDRHCALAAQVLRLLQSSSGYSSVPIPAALHHALWEAEPLIFPFSPRRQDYCYEPQSHARQRELVRLVERIRDCRPFRISSSREIPLDLRCRTDNDDVYFSSPEAQLLAAYRACYNKFSDYWNNPPTSMLW